MDRNWGNQKPNSALNTKMGNESDMSLLSAYRYILETNVLSNTAVLHSHRLISALVFRLLYGIILLNFKTLGWLV